MNKYKIEVNINLWKEITVEANNIDEAQDEVLKMREEGNILFCDTDESPDGMMLGETTLISGIEPFSVINLPTEYRRRMEIMLIKQLPVEKLEDQYIHKLMWAMLELLTDEESFTHTFADDMNLNEFISLNIDILA